jgi:hypothetical protein
MQRCLKPLRVNIVFGFYFLVRFFRRASMFSICQIGTANGPDLSDEPAD